MRSTSMLAALGCAVLLGGCGDDTTSAPEMSARDLAVVTGAAPTCADYCAKIQASCRAGSGDGGGHAQYASSADCAMQCTTAAGWPAGNLGDTTGNTIGCRLYHAGAAASDPVTHCPHAGPTGGDMCGSWCDNYCQLMAKNCSGANAVYDAAACMTKCPTIPSNGQPGDTSGNSVQCRIYHLGVAAANPTLHCAHAKTVADLPGGPCS